MKILLTGMTAATCGKGNRLGIINASGLLPLMLREMGHEVDQRVVDIGEDLSVYDTIVCGVASPLSMTAGCKYPALYAISNAYRAGCRLGFFVDDWRLRTIKHNFRTCQRLPSRLVRDFFKNCRGWEWACEHIDDELLGVINAMCDRPWPPTLVPLMSWGDYSQITQHVPEGSMRPFDPSCYVAPVTWDTTHKERRWVDAALIAKGQGAELTCEVTWPRVEFMSGRDGNKIPETEVVRHCASARGVISRTHREIDGSGWWRVRYIYAAQTRCVLAANSRRELMGLGDAYVADIPTVEAMTDAELDDAAAAQREALRNVMWKREHLHEVLHDYLCTL